MYMIDRNKKVIGELKTGRIRGLSEMYDDMRKHPYCGSQTDESCQRILDRHIDELGPEGMGGHMCTKDQLIKDLERISKNRLDNLNEARMTSTAYIQELRKTMLLWEKRYYQMAKENEELREKQEAVVGIQKGLASIDKDGGIPVEKAGKKFDQLRKEKDSLQFSVDWNNENLEEIHKMLQGDLSHDKVASAKRRIKGLLRS